MASVMFSLMSALLSACGLARRMITKQQVSSPMHLAGVPLHGYAAVFNEGRAEFLRDVKHETVDGREHWILSLRKGLSKQHFDGNARHNGIQMVGHADVLPFMEFKGTMEELAELLEKIGKDVVSVEPDMPTHLLDGDYAHISDVQVDDAPEVKTMQMIGKDASAQRGICQENMMLIGRDHRTHTGRGVHVYVMDTGIRISHVELANHADAVFEIGCSASACEWNDCTDNPSPSCALDPNGHGTHVASTIAGIDLGIAPDAYIHSVQVLNGEGQGLVSWALEGMDYVISRGKKPGVLSMSLGTKTTPDNTDESAFEHAVQIAIDNGFTVVIASGNYNEDACDFVPASVTKGITVGSMYVSRYSGREKESRFSNFGACVDILAPGEGIWASWNTGDRAAAKRSGTSMACPHVTGVVAMILEKNESLSPAEVWDELRTEYAIVGRVHGLKPNSPNLRLSIGPSGRCAPPIRDSGAHRQSGFGVLLLGLLVGRHL